MIQPEDRLAEDRLIEALSLTPHPEGGHYRQTYRAASEIPAAALPQEYGGARAYSTAIYFLLTGEDFSAFHRIRSDEVWHFYSGSSLEIQVIHPGGRYERIRLGTDVAAGEVFQAIVPGGCWFGACLADPRPARAGRRVYALVGCTVAPGFDFDDFELANRQRLSEMYPMHRSIIQRLTRE
ncbi:MAG TPA: cupin domain-containing protein [Levilinea sp.]|nr:cupin domain-containing protein [Levilinea sp.]